MLSNQAELTILGFAWAAGFDAAALETVRLASRLSTADGLVELIDARREGLSGRKGCLSPCLEKAHHAHFHLVEVKLYE
jgi:hypothetical protein